MKHKVNKLNGYRLDCAVAMASGLNFGVSAMRGAPREKMCLLDSPHHNPKWFSPSTNWNDGGPIIDRERILFGETRGGEIGAKFNAYSDDFDGIGPTHLVAAMRAYVTSKLGDEIELPEGT